MPAGRDEQIWAQAKEAAAKQGHAQDWPYVMAIYTKMRRGIEAEESTGAQGIRKGPSLVLDLSKAIPLGRPSDFAARLARHHGMMPKRGGPTGPLRTADSPERLMNKRPPEWSVDRHLALPMRTGLDVVKGLGFEPTKEAELGSWLDRLARQEPEHQYRAAVFQKSRFEGWPAEVQHEFGHRALRFYLESRANVAKALFEPTGGAYHMRVTRKDPETGKARHRHYYDPKEYERHHGVHMSGEQVRKQYLADKTLSMCDEAGDCGAKASAFAQLTRDYGGDAVHAALDEHVKGGRVVHKKGSFYRVGKKALQSK